MHEDVGRVTADDFGSRSSSYLYGGYKDDDFQLIDAVIEQNRAIGAVKVDKFFPPMDGEFHLSAPMASIWIMQLGTIYSFYDIGRPHKDREIYLRDFSMRCRKRILELEKILLEIEVTSKAQRSGNHHYKAKFDIDVGSFIGTLSWVMSTEPLPGY